MMIQLSYASILKPTPIKGETLRTIRDVLTVSRRNNHQHNITGFLLFDGGCCFQILEGDAEAVSRRYAHIKADARHNIVKVLGEREIKVRDFPAWSMGSIVRDTSHAGIFLNHGFDRRLDPNTVTAAALLALAMDMQAYETQRAAQT